MRGVSKDGPRARAVILRDAAKWPLLRMTISVEVDGYAGQARFLILRSGHLAASRWMSNARLMVRDARKPALLTMRIFNRKDLI